MRRGRADEETQRETVIYIPEWKAWNSSSPYPANTLIWDFWPPELWEDQFRLHKPPNPWDLVIAVPGNQYRKKPSPIVCGGSFWGSWVPRKRISALLSRPEDSFSLPLAYHISDTGMGNVCGMLSLGLSSSQTKPPLSSSGFLVVNSSSQATHSLWWGNPLPPVFSLDSSHLREGKRTSSQSYAPAGSLSRVNSEKISSLTSVVSVIWENTLVWDSHTLNKPLRVYLI